MKSNPPAPRPAAAQTKKSVLIIDDHLIVRQGLTHLINRQEDLCACDDLGDARQGLDAISLHHPDVVIVDISLPGMSGVEFIKNAKALQPNLPIVVFSMHDESLYAERVLRAGAFGYVMKKAESEEILDALRKALRGEFHMSGAVGGTLFQKFLGRRHSADAPAVSNLSDRELEVFEMIGNGKTSREIATSLRISIKTVDTHRLHIKDKLGLRTATELVQHAVHHIGKEADV